MRRRDFITLLGGAAAAWPLAARAQRDRVRRIGILMGWSENDPEYRPRITLLSNALAKSGWVEGQNLRTDIRWTNGDPGLARSLAKELVATQPDVILAATTPATAAVQQETHAIPIVFAVVSDPVGAGFVASLPRPGGNITGFINVEAAMGGKWLDLLKKVAPGLTKVAIMANPDTAPAGGSYFLSSFEMAARTLAIEPIVAKVRSDAEIETVVSSLGRDGNAGLVVTTDAFMSIHRGPIIAATARNRVPAVAEMTTYAKEGGLLSYGVNTDDLFPRAAAYVDRILKGERPADLPVQLPTKFDLIVNLKAAKALGLGVPDTVLALADQVIE
jgi:putative ABC transport system substrate-binding protein